MAAQGMGRCRSRLNKWINTGTSTRGSPYKMKGWRNVIATRKGPGWLEAGSFAVEAGGTGGRHGSGAARGVAAVHRPGRGPRVRRPFDGQKLSLARSNVQRALLAHRHRPPQ